MIPTDLIFSDMLEELEDRSVKSDEQQLEKMDSLGFETVWLVPNLGSLSFFAALFPLMIITIFILRAGTICCGHRATIWRLKVSRFVFWRWSIRFLTDSYIVIALCCVLNLINANFEIYETKVNTALSVLIFVFISVYPIVIQRFLYKKRGLMKRTIFRSKFSSAYEGLNEKNKKFLIYPLFFFYRRLILAVTLLTMNTQLFAQYVTLLYTSLATIALIGEQAPFKSKELNRAEILHEVVFLVALYHTLCFTPMVQNV